MKKRRHSTQNFYDNVIDSFGSVSMDSRLLLSTVSRVRLWCVCSGVLMEYIQLFQCLFGSKMLFIKKRTMFKKIFNSISTQFCQDRKHDKGRKRQTGSTRFITDSTFLNRVAMSENLLLGNCIFAWTKRYAGNDC